MGTDIYESLGVPKIVNCVGYATRVGGSCPSTAVLDAMRQAQQAYVEIDDLQAAASRVISEATSAEAGIVTCGAAAALTLAAAACLAGNDPEIMNQLPDAGERNEIIYPKAGRFDYEHPLRAAGARLIELDYDAKDALTQIEASIGPKTAALGYAWYHSDERPRIEDLAQLAHSHGLPLIVDAAMALPPIDNLTGFISRGADLVAFSGGKHLGGPQSSGILCGRRDLIRSAWVQMVDMDVRAGTWSLRGLVDEGWIPHPPRHGIGRSMKVGKDAIAGLIVALKAYRQRDHASELQLWKTITSEIATGLSRVAGLRIQQLFPGPTGQPYPVVQIDVDPQTAALTLAELIRELREIRRKVILCEHEELENRAFIYPMCLSREEATYIVFSIERILQRKQVQEGIHPCQPAT